MLRADGVRCSATVISESSTLALPPGIDLLTVPMGSKLSKIRHLLASGRVGAGIYVCVVDSDVRLDLHACRDLIRATMQGRYGIGFGVVESAGGTRWLDGCIALDKRLSHRIWRPLLHRLGVGITVPGQFVVYGPELLHGAPHLTETYLDDLYFGLRCRTLDLPFLRQDKVVCRESGRTAWSTLLGQRIRWMKGLFRLAWAASRGLGGWHYCAIHYALYHGIPMAAGVGLAVLAAGGAWMAALALALAGTLTLAGLRLTFYPLAILYLITFPVIHLLATLGAVLPISVTRLRRR